MRERCDKSGNQVKIAGKMESHRFARDGLLSLAASELGRDHGDHALFPMRIAGSRSAPFSDFLRWRPAAGSDISASRPLCRSPGDLVVAAVMDGGTLEDGQRVLSLRLDESRQVKFNYAVSEEEGVFRVTLRKGGDVKTVELWAGAEPPLIGAR